MIAPQVARRWRSGSRVCVPSGLCSTCGRDTAGSGQRDQDGDLHCPDCVEDPDRAPVTLRTGAMPWANAT